MVSLASEIVARVVYRGIDSTETLPSLFGETSLLHELPTPHRETVLPTIVLLSETQTLRCINDGNTTSASSRPLYPSSLTVRQDVSDHQRPHSRATPETHRRPKA